MTGKNIIFLISQPRSGSTLLQRILSNHTQISTNSELWLALPMFYKDNINNFKINPKAIFNGKSCEKAIKTSLSYIDDIDNKIKPFFANFYERIINEFNIKNESLYFLDKTPRYYYILEELIQYFPNSKIILLHRNPFSVLNSILTTWVKKAPFFLSYYRDDLLLCPKILSESKFKTNSNLYHLNYENLIENSEEEIKKLCQFIEIEYEKKMLVINSKEDKWKFGDPINAFNKTKIDNKSKDNWKKIRNAQHWRFYSDYLKELQKLELTEFEKTEKELLELIQNSKPNIFKRKLTFSLKFCLSDISAYYYVPIIKIYRTILKKIWKQ